jgi:hypothetical protein
MGGVELSGAKRAPRERPSESALPNDGLIEQPQGTGLVNNGRENWPNGLVERLCGTALVDIGWEDRPSGSAIWVGESEDTTALPQVYTLPIKRKDSLPLSDSLLKCCAGPVGPSAMQVVRDDGESHKPIDADLLRLKQLKWEHDLAKAVKSDNAEVPVHIWDNAICDGEVTAMERKVITLFRERILKKYLRKLLRDVLGFLATKYGGMTGELAGVPRWRSRATSGPKGELQPRLHCKAMHEIMKRAADNDWFEYPAGLRLHYFCFLERYCLQACNEVTIFFKDEGSTQMRQQPHLSGPDKQDVLKSKISKFIKKGYIIPLEPGQIKSLIKYFAVPKGILDGVAQDWQVVFYAGTN